MNANKMMMIVVAAVAVVVAGCETAPRLATGKYEGAAAKVAPKHVLLVGWDGFAGNTLEAAKLPTLRKLMAEGAWTLHSRSILPSASSCCWHSIFTCSASEQHGYIAWNSKEPAFPASATGPNGKYPDVMYLLRQRKPDAEIGFVYDWDGMGFTADTNACSYVRFLPHEEVTAAAIAYVKEKKPAFFTVYYDSPDDKGHQNGWGSPEYLDRLAELDADLAKLLDAVKEAGMLEDTVVMVTSDHGGKGKGHGGPTLSEMERPVVLWGKGVKRGHELAFPGTNYDTGATLAALLGIDPPACWIGRPFDEAFAR
ncbi:MAG: alkaline phosphatase [Kiritimatiellae bacterium]|nr:alkaline phosphatase [Kiritimatiellia bacterium]